MRLHLIAGLSAALTLLGASPLLAQTAPAACPAKAFPDFLAKFMDDEQVQRAFTAAPLATSFVRQNDVGDPMTVTRRLTAEAIKYPVMPTRAKVEADQLKLTTKGDAKRQTVRIEKSDTDAKTDYVFEAGDCWRLVTVDDQSL